MAYKPPKGVRPPQLEGKRRGRPRGSKNWISGWRDAQWGYDHRDDNCPKFPSSAAAVWWRLAQAFPCESRLRRGLRVFSLALLPLGYADWTSPVTKPHTFESNHHAWAARERSHRRRKPRKRGHFRHPR